jgi:hypothetical protein
MNETFWHIFYQSELQSVYALLVLPVAFLAYRLAAPPDSRRAVVPGASRFVAALTLVFAVETMIDPIATGPLLDSAPLGESVAGLLIPFLFVYLGDFRVILLAMGVAQPSRSLRKTLASAAGVSLIVPAFAGSGFMWARWISPDAHGQILWMLYEGGFLVLAVVLSRVWVPRVAEGDAAVASFLRSVFGFSAAYYALWLAADLLIVVGGLDLGWAIRIVPNQLYYAVWVPFVYGRFFSAPLSKAAR